MGGYFYQEETMNIFCKIRWWLYQNEPMICAKCGKIVRRKNIWQTLLTTGAFVLLCKKCLDEVYTPWQN